MSRAEGNPTSTTYRAVIDDVVTRVKPEFVQEGVNESVLDELRALWESKLLQSGAIDSPPQRPPSLPMSYRPGGYLPRPGMPSQAYAPGTATAGGYTAGPIHYDASLLKHEYQVSQSGPMQRIPVPLYPPTAHPTAGAGLTPVYRPQQSPAAAAPAPVYRPQPGVMPSQGAPAPSYQLQGSLSGAPAPVYRPQPVAQMLRPQPQPQLPLPQQQLRPIGAPAPVYRPQPLPASNGPSTRPAAAPTAVYRPQPVVAATGAPQPVYIPSQPQQQPGGSIGAALAPVYRPQPVAGVPAPLYQPRPAAASHASSPLIQPQLAAVAATRAPVYQPQPAEGSSAPAPAVYQPQPGGGGLAGVKRTADGPLQAPPAQRPQPSIPQRDGEGDEEEDEGDLAADDELDEGDDLAGLSSDEDEDAAIPDVILAQFTKVHRSKNRWKCVLKSGVMHINGRDVLFKSCQGEMTF